MLRRYHGSVRLDPERLGRDAGRIAEEIVQHLVALRGAHVEVTLDIAAHMPEGPQSTWSARSRRMGAPSGSPLRASKSSNRVCEAHNEMQT